MYIHSDLVSDIFLILLVSTCQSVIDLVVDDGSSTWAEAHVTALQLSSSHHPSWWRKCLQLESPRGPDQQANTRPEICYWQHSMNGGSFLRGQATISQERPE
ncbi:hypothetical protein ACQKWADRAFT_77159 [Trichoderma austrokoningii]